jgi:hypothetical protein
MSGLRGAAISSAARSAEDVRRLPRQISSTLWQASLSRAPRGRPRLTQGIRRRRSHDYAWYTFRSRSWLEITKDFGIDFFVKGAACRCFDQALERKPSNAWARKMPALIRPKNAVTVCIIASVLWRPVADRTTCHPAQSKGFPTDSQFRRGLMISCNTALATAPAVTPVQSVWA